MMKFFASLTFFQGCCLLIGRRPVRPEFLPCSDGEVGAAGLLGRGGGRNGLTAAVRSMHARFILSFL